MKSSLSTIVAASTLAFLSACGGGGGDSPPQPGGSKVAITSANQDAAVRAGVGAGLSVATTQGSVGGLSPAGAAGRTHALDAVLRRAVAAARTTRKGIASASVHPVAAISDTQPCGFSGTLTVTIDDRDANNALSAGDVVTASFAQCQDKATTSVNGAIAITLTTTPTGTQFAANANFQNVIATDDGVSSTLAGSVTVAETDLPTVTETTLTVGGSGLTASTVSTGYSDSVSFAPAFVIRADASSSGEVSVSLSGTMTAQSLGGSITISTPQPLVEGASDNYPGAGQVVVTGASGSTVRATVLDNTQVRLELDANGDGSYESTSTVAWTALIA